MPPATPGQPQPRTLRRPQVSGTLQTRGVPHAYRRPTAHRDTSPLHTRSTHLWTGACTHRDSTLTLTPTSMGAPRPTHTEAQVHTGRYRHMRPAPAVLRCTPGSTHTARSARTDSACKQGHPPQNPATYRHLREHPEFLRSWGPCKPLSPAHSCHTWVHAHIHTLPSLAAPAPPQTLQIPTQNPSSPSDPL